MARSKKGISVSQRKYIHNILTETGTPGCKSSDTPIEAGEKKTMKIHLKRTNINNLLKN